MGRRNVTAALSKELRDAAKYARDIGAKTFERWCLLELGGYFASNPAMDAKVTVPEYRTVVGQHVDIYGRSLVLPANLAFVGETRLRNGVEELEELAGTRDTVVIHDPRMCELIKDYLKVEVYSFRFSRVNLVGVFSAIRNRLDVELHNLKPSNPRPRTVKADDEIFELKPNVYGIGINLRALWRSLRK